MKKLIIFVALFSLVFALPLCANAGPFDKGTDIGVYCWRLDPYADMVCFSIEQRNIFYDLVGWQHGPGSYKVPLTGAGLFDDYINQFRFSFTYYNTDGTLWHYAADFDLLSLNGGWVDDTGDSGTLTYIGSGPQRSYRGGQLKDSP
jgi:hypothetical protein